MFSRQFLSENSIKSFSRKPKITWTMRRCRGLRGDKHTWGYFSGDETRSKTIAKDNDNWKKVPYTQSLLSWKSIHHRWYAEKLAASYPGNPLDLTKTSLLLLCLQQVKKSFEESTSLKEMYVLTNFGKNFSRKPRSESKIASKPTFVHFA